MKTVVKLIKNETKINIEEIDLCRLCKNFVFGNVFINLKTMLELKNMKHFFNEYFPEIDLEVIEECTICGYCQQSISGFYNLISSIATEQKTKIELKVKESISKENKPIKETYSIKPYMWNCTKCNYQTEEWKWFKNHMAKRHSEKVGPPLYKCDICSYQTNHKTVYEKHSFTHNRNANRMAFKCELCSYSTFRKDALTEHMVTHETAKHKCEYCNILLKSRKALRRHMLCKHECQFIKHQTFKCTLCHYSSLRKDCLQRHMLVHKDIKKMFSCHQCDYSSTYKSCLASHMLVHNNTEESKVYHCKECSYRTNRKSSLQNHMIIHAPTMRDTFKCYTCGYNAVSKIKLKKHINNKHTN